MTDENPITQRLAAISGLQTGRRVIAPGELVPPPHALPEPKPEPKPKTPRSAVEWTPERRAAHARRMVKMWADPAKREEIKRRVRAGRNKSKKAKGR